MSISQDTLKNWSLERLKMELSSRQNEFNKLEREKDEMYDEYERERNSNPTYYKYGEGAEAGVAPDFDSYYSAMDRIEEEIAQIENELRQRL